MAPRVCPRTCPGKHTASFFLPVAILAQGTFRSCATCLLVIGPAPATMPKSRAGKLGHLRPGKGTVGLGNSQLAQKKKARGRNLPGRRPAESGGNPWRVLTQTFQNPWRKLSRIFVEILQDFLSTFVSDSSAIPLLSLAFPWLFRGFSWGSRRRFS